ncbi:MAG: helix-turn-helix domain-containing protein [Elainella sp. Prado103]|nr:helix-turn-helix domain-containing protein [Elainella sp. Prado103]
MHTRLEQMYTQTDHQTIADLVPSTWKELGIAMEELQVAHEELRHQNEQITATLQDAAVQHHYYQSLLNYIPEAYLVTTLEGKIQEANRLAAGLLRVPQPFLLGKLLVNFILPDQRFQFRMEMARVSEVNQLRVWPAWFQPRDAAPVQLSLSTIAHQLHPQEPILHWILREMPETWTTLAHSTCATAQMNASTDSAPAVPTQTYAKGDLIPLRPQILWQVKEGLVKLHTLTEKNEETLIGLVGPKMPFGLCSTFLPVYQATALTEVEVAMYSLTEIKAVPALAQLLLPHLNRRVEQMEALLSIAGQRHVKDRLYLFLRLLQREIGEPIDQGIRLTLRLTHEEIANACCTSRVTITRLLGELQKQGRVTIDIKSHIILHH